MKELEPMQDHQNLLTRAKGPGVYAWANFYGNIANSTSGLPGIGVYGWENITAGRDRDFSGWKDQNVVGVLTRGTAVISTPSRETALFEGDFFAAPGPGEITLGPKSHAFAFGVTPADGHEIQFPVFGARLPQPPEGPTEDPRHWIAALYRHPWPTYPRLDAIVIDQDASFYFPGAYPDSGWAVGIVVQGVVQIITPDPEIKNLVITQGTIFALRKEALPTLQARTPSTIAIGTVQEKIPTANNERTKTP